MGSGAYLSKVQIKEIKKAITDKTPDQLKFNFALWTSEAVRLYIKRTYQIILAPRTVRAYLQDWGFTPQKPIKRFYERDEASVQKWLKVDYPAIKKRAKEENALIFWSDETGVRSGDCNGRGYAPKGRTPIKKVKGRIEKVNMISAITNQGMVRFKFYEGKLQYEILVDFFSRVIRSSQKKVFLILDNLPAHHSKRIRAWELKRRDKIALFYLPKYAPDLNPDEYLNCDLKQSIRTKAEPREKRQLKKIASRNMRRLQRMSKRVKSYFNCESIKYASDFMPG